MDPITAVSFAASIITFVDFASELVSGACELHKSPTGRTSKNIHIEDVITDLQDVTDDLDTDSLGNSREAKRLRRLATQCNKLADELLSVLKQLRLDGNQKRPWKSLVVKWRNMRKVEEVNAVEERLREYRSEIMLQLSLLISDRQSSVCAKLDVMKAEAAQLKSQTGRDLDSIREQIRQILMSTKHIEDSSKLSPDKYADIPQLLQQLKRLNSTIPTQHRILRQLMYNSMHLREDSIHVAESGTCEWILEDVKEIPAPERILQKIDELKERKNSNSSANGDGDSNLSDNANENNGPQSKIDQNSSGEDAKNSEPALSSSTNRSAQDESFGETLHENSQYLRKSAATQFRRWLRSGNGIFHICGKAGSGKSTLMKFIRNHPSTRNELKQWARCKELVLAYFYFSNNTGDESQMSLDSLYRSILFECLSQCPDLIPEVFPQQWRNFHASNADSMLESNEFTKPKILDAFNILTSKRLNLRYRLCFFIDGLDEYHGDTYEHWKFAEMLRDLASGNDVKICASSRPHTEYLDTFCPPNHVRILLQNLNTYDIYIFSRKILENDERYPQIQDVYLDLAFQLSSRSEGVFLWAVFAARLLLTSLGCGGDPQTLTRSLDIVPEQLDALFEKLLASVSKHDRSQCDKMLCLTLMNPFDDPLSTVSYSWIKELEDPGFPPLGTSPYSEDEIMRREKIVERQLDKSTKGLLEIAKRKIVFKKSPNNPAGAHSWNVVQFLHRTFREFLQQRSQQNYFLQNFPGFTPGEIYGKIRLAEVSYRCPSGMAEDIDLRSHLVRNGMFALSPLSYRAPNGLWGLPLAITERLGITCQDKGFINALYENSRYVFEQQTDDTSFLHLAAASGHEEYICSRPEEVARLLNFQGVNLSIELSALVEGHFNLASELLRQGGSVHRQILLHGKYPHADDQMLETQTVPIWLVVVYRALAYEFYFGYSFSSDNESSLRAIRIWKFLQKYVMNSVDAEEWGCQVSIMNETETCVSIGGLFQMLAEYYSSPEVASFTKQDGSQILECMPITTIKSGHCESPQMPCEVMPANDSNLVHTLRRSGAKFEVKFHNYVMNDEWVYRIW